MDIRSDCVLFVQIFCSCCFFFLVSLFAHAIRLSQYGSMVLLLTVAAAKAVFVIDFESLMVKSIFSCLHCSLFVVSNFVFFVFRSLAVSHHVRFSLSFQYVRVAICKSKTNTFLIKMNYDKKILTIIFYLVFEVKENTTSTPNHISRQF